MRWTASLSAGWHSDHAQAPHAPRPPTGDRGSRTARSTRRPHASPGPTRGGWRRILARDAGRPDRPPRAPSGHSLQPASILSIAVQIIDRPGVPAKRERAFPAQTCESRSSFDIGDPRGQDHGNACHKLTHTLRGRFFDIDRHERARIERGTGCPRPRPPDRRGRRSSAIFDHDPRSRRTATERDRPRRAARFAAPPRQDARANQRFEPVPDLGRVRGDQFGHGPAAVGHRDGLAILHPAEILAQPVLQFTHPNRRHAGTPI